MSATVRISLDIVGNEPIKMGVKSPSSKASMGVAAPIVVGLLPEYEGSYEVTPTEDTQVLNTKDKQTKENIVINPIPQNYGLITYNGSTITVS